jgi:hypothetical protein
LEHLIGWLLFRLDDAFRPRLRSVVPDPAALTSDPAGYFAAHGGVHFSPRRHPVIAVLAFIPGALLGIVFGMIAETVFVGPKPAWPLGWWELVFVSVGLVAGPIVCWHVSRGGDLRLVPMGVVFTYRRQDVLCPWSAIDFWREWEWTSRDDPWWTVPVHPYQLDHITLVVRGKVRKSGRDIRAVHFWVAKPGVIRRLFSRTPSPDPDTVAVKDIYGVRPDEWLPLVMRIAPHAPFETGAPTPDDGNKEAFSQEF